MEEELSRCARGQTIATLINGRVIIHVVKFQEFDIDHPQLSTFKRFKETHSSDIVPENIQLDKTVSKIGMEINAMSYDNFTICSLL